METKKKRPWTGELRLTNEDSTVTATADEERIRLEFASGGETQLRIEFSQSLVAKCPPHMMPTHVQAAASAMLGMFGINLGGELMPVELMGKALEAYIEQMVSATVGDDPASVARAFTETIGVDNVKRLVEMGASQAMDIVRNALLEKEPSAELAELVESHAAKVWVELEKLVEPAQAS
jgi:hypothetical protein